MRLIEREKQKIFNFYSHHPFLENKPPASNKMNEGLEGLLFLSQGRREKKRKKLKDSNPQFKVPNSFNIPGNLLKLRVLEIESQEEPPSKPKNNKRMKSAWYDAQINTTMTR